MSKEADLSSVSSATRNLRFRIYSEVENICAEKIQNAKANEEEMIDTVAEFFILGQGLKIIAPIRSGFSYWPSVLFNVKITDI